jgi:hypothetical protein
MHCRQCTVCLPRCDAHHPQVLDRLLVKFTQTGHRVLLFWCVQWAGTGCMQPAGAPGWAGLGHVGVLVGTPCPAPSFIEAGTQTYTHSWNTLVVLRSTMTKLLDLLERYLQWRLLPGGKQMQYRCVWGGEGGGRVAKWLLESGEWLCWLCRTQPFIAGPPLRLSSSGCVGAPGWLAGWLFLWPAVLALACWLVLGRLCGGALGGCWGTASHVKVSCQQLPATPPILCDGSYPKYCCSYLCPLA